MNFIMHKIVNVCCDCNEIGFELDNGETIYQYGDKWLETEYQQKHYEPVVDTECNLMGFVLTEIEIEIED